jgi:DNA modification methylase
MKQIKTISIKCDCKDFLKLEDMTVMQGNLKERNDTDYEKIKKSILTYSFSFPFFIWKSGKTNYLIDGTGRHSCLLRMQEEGYIIPDLPVVYISCKDKKDAKQKLLRLNSQYGKMSKQSVLEFAEDIDLNFDEIALPDTVIDFTDQGGEIAETEGDDEAPEVDEKSEPVSKRGEMYELGNSILMCGDSTNAEDVARLMGGEKADMVFTDPPYNVNYADKNSFLNEADKGNRIQEDIENDHYSDDNECGEKLWKPAFSNCYENAKDKCSIYVTMPQGGAHMMMMMMMIKESGWQVKHELIWVKNNHVLGRVDYYYKHEPILYGWKKTHKWVGKGKFDKSVWEIDKPLKSDLHPTMKPIELIENALLNSSNKNDLILDLFGGSGSTLIASEKNGRKARLMEIEPKYCDVIRRRYTNWAKENNKPLTSGCLED